QNDGAAAETIRPRREKQGASGHAEQARAQQNSGLSPLQMPLRRNRGSGEGHDEDVEPVQHIEHDTNCHCSHLEGRHRPFVDQLAYLGMHFLFPGWLRALAALYGGLTPKRSRTSSDANATVQT